MAQAYVPVALGGRFQAVTGTGLSVITKSDVQPIGPCATILVGGAGNLAVTMYDGTTFTIPVVAGQQLALSPKLVNNATTATNLFAQF